MGFEHPFILLAHFPSKPSHSKMEWVEDRAYLAAAAAGGEPLPNIASLSGARD